MCSLLSHDHVSIEPLTKFRRPRRSCNEPEAEQTEAFAPCESLSHGTERLAIRAPHYVCSRIAQHENMRTSRDVYHRLMHDHELGMASHAVVGYLDRFKGAMELPLLRFRTGDIPMHRVLYFRSGSEFVWHKETRLDLIFRSTDTIAANRPEMVALRERDRETAAANKREQEEQAVLRNWNAVGSRQLSVSFTETKRTPVFIESAFSGDWVAHDSCNARAASANDFEGMQSQLSFSTLNVLHDLHLPAELKVFTPRRWQAIVDLVLSTGSQVWALTEVTRAFATYILDDPEIRRLYAASDCASAGFQTLPSEDSATGQLLLIRRDASVEAVYHARSQAATSKQIVYAVVGLNHDVSAAVCAIHLTSGQHGRSRTPSAVEKRRAQLSFAVEQLSRLQSDQQSRTIQVLLGDFNFKSGADDAACRDVLLGFSEADAADGLWTFDPKSNGLAHLNGGAGALTSRVDRIYAKADSKSGRLDAVAHNLIATDLLVSPSSPVFEELRGLVPFGLHVSDHYGVSTTFGDVFEVSPEKPPCSDMWTMRTALAILPDESIRRSIDTEFRALWDPAQPKWPAHINVLFPFVHPTLFTAASSAIADHLVLEWNNSKKWNGRINLRQVARLKHKRSETICLVPHATDFANEIHRTVSAAAQAVAGPAPQRTDKALQQAYRPHLTVGKTRLSPPDPSAHSMVARLREQADLKGAVEWSFDVESLVVLQNVDGRMQPGRFISMPKWSDHDALQNTTTFIRALVRQALGGSDAFELVPIGSSVLTRSEYSSDLDVVLRLQDRAPELSVSTFAKSAWKLIPGHALVRSVGDAAAPIVRVECAPGSGLLNTDILVGDGLAARQAIADSVEVVRIWRGIEERALDGLLASTLSEIKQWASRVRLTNRAFGLFAGVSWTVMLLCVVRSSKESDCRSKLDLLKLFFGKFHAFEWECFAVTAGGPIARTRVRSSDGRNIANDMCVVLTPASSVNANRGTCGSAVHALCEEMSVASAALADAENLEPWQELQGRPRLPFQTMFKHCLVIDILAPSLAEMSELEGWVRGRFVQFLGDMAEQGVALRPDDCFSSQECGPDSLRKMRLFCGIDEVASSAQSQYWPLIATKAQKSFTDKLGSWQGRSPRSSIQVSLVQSSTNASSTHGFARPQEW